MHHEPNFLYCKIIWLCFTRNKRCMWKVRMKHWLCPRKDLHLAYTTWIFLELLFQLEKHQRNWLLKSSSHCTFSVYISCKDNHAHPFTFSFLACKEKSLTVKASDHVLMILYCVCMCVGDLCPQGSRWSIYLLLCLNLFSTHKHGPV